MRLQDMARRRPVTLSHQNLRDRYNLLGAREHASGVGSMPRSRNTFTSLVAVEDPHADPVTGRRGRLVATVNRAVDILEWERSHGRISDEAYCAGRVVQALWERAAGPSGGGQWLEGSRMDAELAKELAIVRRIDTAREVQARIDGIRRQLGMLDARIVEFVLRDGLSYEDIATRQGKGGRYAIAYFAQRFRDALEVLGQARGAAP